jgi:hypothetical protein
MLTTIALLTLAALIGGTLGTAGRMLGARLENPTP